MRPGMSRNETMSLKSNGNSAANSPVSTAECRMKALLLSKYKHLEIADLPVPRAEPDEVLVRVAACGICGSDVHGYDGSSGRRIPPIVMGHEAAGRIAATGSR